MSAIMLLRITGFLLLGTFLFACLLFLIGAAGGKYLKRKKQKTTQFARIAKEWVVLTYLITILLLILVTTILVH
ncbi:MAG: hypothetical protein QM644_15000 [Mobilitalea sp.]